MEGEFRMKVLKSRKLCVALMALIFIFISSAFGLSFIKKANAGYWFDPNEDEYIIDSEDHLKALYEALLPGSTFEYNNFFGKSIKLGADINITSKWDPIGGDGDKFFNGNFDGNGRLINNLDASLFGTIGVDGVVKNLGIDSGLIRENIDSGVVGAIAKKNYGKIENCSNKAEVDGTGTIGGIAGINESSGIIENSFNIGNINGDSSGGIAGTNYGTIKKCFNTGTIRGGISGGIAGEHCGITGECNNNIIKNCYNVGSVGGSQDSGGIAGTAFDSEISNCYSAAKIIENNNVGGIAGIFGNVTINNCYFNSDLFNGDIVGNGSIKYFENNEILTTYAMINYDALAQGEPGGTMKYLQNKENGEDVWFHLDAQSGPEGKGGFRFYPELVVFGGSDIARESVRVSTSGQYFFQQGEKFNYTYGEALSKNNELLENGAIADYYGSYLLGTFAFKQPDYVPVVGTTSVAIVFTSINDETLEFALKITVSKAKLTVTADNKTKERGTANPEFTATVTGFVLGEDDSVIDGGFAFSTTATASSPAGEYGIEVSTGTASAPNYDFEFKDGTLTISGSAEKQKIEMPTIAGRSFTYNGSDQGPVVPYNDAYVISGEAFATNAGTYKLVVSLSDNVNCEWSDGTTGDITINWEIKKAAAEIEFTDILEAKVGDKLSSVTLPLNFRWKDENLELNKAGEIKVWAVYDPDPENYNSVEVELTITVSEAPKSPGLSPATLGLMGGGIALVVLGSILMIVFIVRRRKQKLG